MFKKIILSSLAFFLFAMPTFAFESSDIIDNSSSSDTKVYNYDFDVLLMDFVITDNDGESDILQALTVNNTRNADDTDISKVTLWSDDGDGIWQGYMIDNKIADAVRTESRSWIFSGLNTIIPVGGLHVYVSAETDTDVTTDNRMQFAVNKLFDENSDGKYDSGDVGLFVESDNDGPSDDNFVSKFVYSLENRGGDVLPPRVVISNIKNGDDFELAEEFIISGFAKDRMRGETSSLRISMVLAGSTPIWNNVNSLTAYFATWDYAVSDLIVGEYDLQMFALDGYGNSIISDLINIKIVEPVVEPEEPVVPEEPEEPITSEEPTSPDDGLIITPKPANISDGDLIRAIGDYKVYVVDGNFRRWIQSSEIFNYYLHFNFSVVKEVSQSDLEYFTESWLVRADGDERVFEINGDGTKHWINMSAEKFTSSGRNWDMIYIINEQERDFYQTGADVIL